MSIRFVAFQNLFGRRANYDWTIQLRKRRGCLSYSPSNNTRSTECRSLTIVKTSSKSLEFWSSEGLSKALLAYDDKKEATR